MSRSAREALRLLILGIVILVCWLLAPKSHGSQTAPTRDELLQTVKHIQSLALETQNELDAEKHAHSQTQAALATAQQATADAQNQFATYQKAAETEIQKGNAAIAQLNSVVKKLHAAKWILCGIWILAVGLAVAKAPLTVKQYALYAAAGLAVAGCSYIWLWL